jgi:hypothetical protein
VQVTIRDTGDLKRLARALGTTAEGKQTRRELSQGFRDVLRPYVPRLRAAYRAGPSRGGRRFRGVPLRTLLARSVRVEVRLTGRQAGARIRADGRRMPNGMRALPAYWEGERPRWRHPVFGNRDVWVIQQPHPAFYRTLRPSERAARREIDQALARITRRLERAP